MALFCAVVWSHLAIDTTFQVKEGQIPGVNLGTVDGKEVQEAFDYVSTLLPKMDCLTKWSSSINCQKKYSSMSC
ncbi:hypothetical protein [Bacillus infantis]|uniref:hypothetical protein n=1 Tax=Bacillus infantis TaxID=324767 RepID=UPI003CFB8EAC